MITPTYKEVKNVLINKGFLFFKKPYSINIIGIRNSKTDNQFTCTLCVLYTTDNMEPVIDYYPCTTKPGKHWLLKPLNSKGTAILQEGQYRGLYKIGKHNRSRPSKAYEALEQKGIANYFRDNNKDSKHDYSGQVFKGNFKTNIHRASSSGWSKFVDKWSAGCQVITGKDWLKFLKICKLSAKRYGNSFTYTLINENDFT